MRAFDATSGKLRFGPGGENPAIGKESLAASAGYGRRTGFRTRVGRSSRRPFRGTCQDTARHSCRRRGPGDAHRIRVLPGWTGSRQKRAGLPRVRVCPSEPVELTTSTDGALQPGWETRRLRGPEPSLPVRQYHDSLAMLFIAYGLLGPAEV